MTTDTAPVGPPVEPTPEERQALREQARDEADAYLTGVLDGSRSVDESYRRDDWQLREWDAVRRMVDTRDDLIGRMERAARDFDRAALYLRGQPGSFNSLGILQAEGPRIDLLAGLFREQFDRARDLVFDRLFEDALAKWEDMQ